MLSHFCTSIFKHNALCDIPDINETAIKSGSYISISDLNPANNVVPNELTHEKWSLD